MAENKWRARAYLAALLVSVLGHAGLLTFALTRVPDASTQRTHAPAPVEFVLLDVAPAPEPPHPAPKSAVRNPTRKRAKAKEPPPAAPAKIASDAPRANPAVNQPGSFLPVPRLTPDNETEAPHGHTLLPDDPSLRPEALRAEEEHRVKQRVEAFTLDELATARAQGGIPHPYFAGLRDAARTELEKRAKEAGVNGTLGKFMSGIGRGYVDSVGSYGKSGNPNVGPSEPGNSTKELNAPMAQSSETLMALSKTKPLIALTLELRQFKDGSPLTARVINASGDPKFDTFVLQTWPAVVAQRGPPPDGAFHGPELRSLWAVEGWLALPKKLEAVTTYLPLPMGTDKMLGALTKEGYHYEFHTRLLRVY